MRVRVRYWSWFKDIARTDQHEYSVPDGCLLGDLLRRVHEDHPKLGEARHATLVAVGVEYQRPDFILRDGDEVSLFPPVQGG